MSIWGFLPALSAIIGHSFPFFGLGDLSYLLNIVHFLFLGSVSPIGNGNLDEFSGSTINLVAMVVLLHFKQKPVDCLRWAYFMRRGEVS